MANLVRLHGGAAELPYLNLSYPVDPAESSLAEGLAAYQELKLRPELQSLPRDRRREITGFLQRLGALLYRVAFPAGQGARLNPSQPLLLQADALWSVYPWELLHDGRQWLALQAGIVRLHPGGDRPPSETGLTRLAAVTAQPLPAGPADALAAAYRVAGARFVTALSEVVEPLEEGNPELTCRVLEHASVEEFRQTVSAAPDILLWSGFAEPEALLLESARLEPERMPLPAVLELVREAVRRGLRLAILNDSLGLLDPARSSAMAAEWLSTGLPWLIRLEGMQARVRQHEYLRGLTRNLTQGFPLLEGHLTAVRRLYRRFEDSWDWSFASFHSRQPPRTGERSPGLEVRIEPSRTPPDRGTPRPLVPMEYRMPGEDPAHPAPPAFRRRRRVFGRHEELRALARAILPERRADSPLIFLSGPAGSGKTVLALEAARRLHRRFAVVLYLNGRDLAARPPEGPGGPALPLAAPAGLERLAGELGMRLGLRPAPGPADRGWLAPLKACLADGEPRLLVLDALESAPGFEPFLAGMAEARTGTRILVLTRGRPPLLPGFRLELPPLDARSLAEVFDEDFAVRLRAHAPGSALMGICQRDLLAARVLRRLERWPGPEALAGLAPPAAGSAAGTRDALLALAADSALGEIGTSARQVLEVLTLLAGPMHRDSVSRMAGVEGRALAEALAELQWYGLAELSDGERYASIPPRLLRVLGERLMTRRTFERLAPRLSLSCEAFLAATGRHLAKAPAGSLWEDASAAFAWQRDAPRRNSAAPREVQRLGVERANLAEAGLILAEEGDVRALTRLNEEARPLARLRWMGELLVLLGAYQFGAAATQGDAAAQARALNRLGSALLIEDRLAEAAKALEQALDRLSQGSDWDALGETYLLLARCYAGLDHLDAAENLLSSALELAYQLGSGSQLTQALEASMWLWERRGSHEEQAEQHLPRAIRYLEEREQGHLAAQVRRLLARSHLRSGRWAEAESGFRQAMQGFLRAGDRREAARTGLRLAECLTRQERAHAAWECFEEARAALTQEQAAEPEPLADTLHAIAELLQRQGRADLALRAYLLVRDWREQAGDRESVIRVLDVLGGLYFRLGQQAESTRCYEERLLLQSERSVATA
jgi:tetratricopeptide (TPR) repeat protein